MSMVEPTPPGRSFGFLVHDVARLMRRRFEYVAKVRRLGLTRAQAAVIMHLSRNEGINQVSLAQLMDIEPITLVRLLDRLQSAGLIERRPDPGDRRARILYLAPAARPLLTRIERLGDVVREEAMAHMSPAEREALAGLLAAMKTNLLERLADQPEETPEPTIPEAING